MKKKDIDKILCELEAGYDMMAEKFSSTRTHFWKDLNFIADEIRIGDRVLDFGCGNGRLIEILGGKGICYVGVDVSSRLIEKAKKKYPENSHKFLKISSQDSLPFDDDYFNKIISVAVFHHFPDEYALDRALELYRVAKPGAALVVTIWNIRQEEHEQETYIPFRNNDEKQVFMRYHRVYSMAELEKIFLETGWKKVAVKAHGNNIILTARK